MSQPEPAPALPVPGANGDAPHPTPGGAVQVMLRFQDVMAKFLETQRSVMLGFLGAGGGSVPSPSGNGLSLAAATVLLPSLATRLTAPGPATIGHAAPPAPAPAAPPAEAPPPAKAAPAVLDRDALLARLLDLLSERTGYPKESLSIDLDLEADLGVDSIKRFEILGTLAETSGAGAGEGQPNLELE